MAIDFAAVGTHWAMTTLTYPREFVRDPGAWRRQLKAMRLRFERKWGEPWRAFIALEWQRPRRKGANAGERAPHWHIVHAMPTRMRREDRDELQTWMRGAWHEVVTGHRAPVGEPGTTVTDRCAHLFFGAKVTVKDNASKAGTYLVGELTRASKARQKELPPEWATGQGRWWYRWSLDVNEIWADLTPPEYEVMRWWLRRIAHRREYHAVFHSRDQGLAIYDRGPGAWRLAHWAMRVVRAMRLDGERPSRYTWSRLLTFPCSCRQAESATPQDDRDHDVGIESVREAA